MSDKPIKWRVVYVTERESGIVQIDMSPEPGFLDGPLPRVDETYFLVNKDAYAILVDIANDVLGPSDD